MSAGGAAPWYRTITREQWRTLAAAKAGWMLDAMDVMLYAFALTAIQKEFGLSGAGAGLLASVTLGASAIGGALFGVVADRIGRVRGLIVSILIYSVFTALIATSSTVFELVLWRTLVGVGLGGEWTCGSVLVAETWPAEHRGKAVGLMQAGWALGYLLAALLAALILPRYGWKPLFLCGIVPALLTVWVRRRVPEPAIWRDARDRKVVRSGRQALSALLRAPLARVTLFATLMISSVMFAYWGLFTWLPAYLASPVAKGGAGLSIVQSSAWLVPLQVGAYAGYVLFGALADRIGRRPAFALFVVVAAGLVPVYGLLGRHAVLLMLLGPAVGFFGHGYFSAFGALLAELFPSSVRATAQGLCYSAGRGVSALAPLAIGLMADRTGIGGALAATSLFFLAGAALMMLLPETRGGKLT